MAASGWSKCLYRRQPFPDNHVDASFLSEMRKNVHVRVHTYWQLVHASTALTQHAASLVLFLMLFRLTIVGSLTEGQLVSAGNATTLGAYLAWLHYGVKGRAPKEQHDGRQRVKAAMLFLMTLLGVSPVLKTLTEDTSDDTIASLAFILFLVNLVFMDYSTPCPSPSLPTINPIALNAAIFASVLLASRLPTRVHVFGLMSLAVNWFALWPLLRQAIKTHLHPTANALQTIIMNVVAIVMLQQWSPGAAIAYTGWAVFVTFACPLWFLRLQRFKNNIHGPWDEASVTIK